jgi:hypothetical protein
MILIQLLVFCLLHLIPADILDSWLRKKLRRGTLKFSPQFSGRVSLYVLAKQLRSTSIKPFALLPNYICNVVSKSFKLAGWEIKTYNTNELLEPDFDELSNSLATKDIGVFLGANVFGSSGLLDLLADHHKVEQLRGNKVHVVLDMAQDISLIDKIPLNLADFVHAVVSFNDKSFPGAMGGGILSAESFNDYQPQLNVKQVVRLYAHLGLKIMSFFRGKFVPRDVPMENFDYSFCETFPYQIHALAISKLQIILAIIGIYFLPLYQKRKQSFLSHNIHMPTKFSDTAAYLLLKKPDSDSTKINDTRRKRKAPYSIDGTQDKGLRPDDLIVHNKGFFDFG